MLAKLSQDCNRVEDNSTVLQLKAGMVNSLSFKNVFDVKCKLSKDIIFCYLVFIKDCNGDRGIIFDSKVHFKVPLWICCVVFGRRPKLGITIFY